MNWNIPYSGPANPLEHSGAPYEYDHSDEVAFGLMLDREREFYVSLKAWADTEGEQVSGCIASNETTCVTDWTFLEVCEVNEEGDFLGPANPSDMKLIKKFVEDEILDCMEGDGFRLKESPADVFPNVMLL